MNCEYGEITRIGDRPNNQDRIRISRSGDSLLLLLADGMGGHADGGLAAQTFIDTVSQRYLQHRQPITQPKKFISSAIRHAHDAVLEAGRRQNPVTTPCTTCVICLIHEGHAWWAHIGDSRLYLIRDQGIAQRTRDHSYVEDLYEKGEITLAEKQTHPMRNYVTQSIGGRQNYPNIAHSGKVMLREGDILLLCSDGLWGPLGDEEIIDSLTSNSLNDALGELANHAEHTAHPYCDNISAIALRLKPQSATSFEENQAGGKTKGATAGTGDLDSAIAEINHAIDLFQEEMNQDNPD